MYKKIKSNENITQPEVNNLLNKIPNYEDYFLINDFSICNSPYQL